MYPRTTGILEVLDSRKPKTKPLFVRWESRKFHSHPIRQTLYCRNTGATLLLTIPDLVSSTVELGATAIKEFSIVVGQVIIPLTTGSVIRLR